MRKRLRRRQIWMRYYGRVRRGLCRTHLDWLVHFRWSEILLAGDARPPGAGGEDGSLWVGELKPQQAAWLEALRPGHAGDFATRWAAGRRCFGAVVEEDGERRCLCYCWVAAGPTPLEGAEGRRWQIPAGLAWRFDAYSHPLALGAYPELAYRTVLQLRQQGWKAVMGYIEFDNRISRRVHARLGARRLGWILDLRLAGLRLRCERHLEAGWNVRWGRTPVQLADFWSESALHAPSAARAAGTD